MNYLQLCQELAREAGIPGSGPTSVTGTLSDEEEDIVRYIKNAVLEIEGQWFDWGFLYAEFSATTTAGSATLSTTVPTDLGAYDLNSFVYNPTSDLYEELTHIDWRTYQKNYTLGTQTNDTPNFFAIKPSDNTIYLAPKPDTSSITVTAQYWKEPTTLADDADTPLIPSAYHRVIVARAGITYGVNEDAPELLAGYTAEYEALLLNLKARYLPSQRNRAFAAANKEMRVYTP